MEKVYTKIREAYVFPDLRDLKVLKPDSCVVRKVGDRLTLIPLKDLKDKPVETARDDYSPVWGYEESQNKPYILDGGERKDAKFCGLCKDRMNGITGNCFNLAVKPNGCSFEPSDQVKPFQIELEGWKKLRPTDTNKHSAFSVPSLSSVDFDPKIAHENRKIRVIARHLPEYQRKKVEKYCSRCIYQGTCRLDSHRVAERCMVTEENMIKQCLTKVRRKYGSVDEFLRLLGFGGAKFRCRVGKQGAGSEWRVAQPLSRNKFAIVEPFNYFSEAKVSRKVIEAQTTPNPLPSEGRERMAALAWHYLGQYHFHRLWVLPKEGGIEVTHRTGEPYHFFRAESFTSFNEIHYFFNR